MIFIDIDVALNIMALNLIKKNDHNNANINLYEIAMFDFIGRRRVL